ncbi:hypothetical protein V6C27_05900 [Peptococcaceae bacterium 1198_IL3148]
MLEHDLFLSLLSDREINSLANSMKIKPNGFAKRGRVKIPTPLLKKELKDVYAYGFKNPNKGSNLYETYKKLGNEFIKHEKTPKLKGEELLRECGNRVDVPDAILLSYLYICDKDLYHDKIKEWCKNKPEGRLFQNYATSTPDEQLTVIFTPEKFSKELVKERVEIFLKDVELPDDIPEKITADFIINFRGKASQAIKLLYIYLTDDENKDNPQAPKLWNTINTWVATKEIELADSTQEMYKKRIEELEKEYSKKEKDYRRTQEKLEKLTEGCNKLKLNNKKVSTELSEVKKQLNKKISTAKTFYGQISKLIEEKEQLTKTITKFEQQLQDLWDVFNTKSVDKINCKYKDAHYKAELLISILPETDSYIIATRKNLAKQLPSFIPEKCLTDINSCLNKQWCENHTGKTLYLHRHAFGTIKNFDETMTFARQNNLNVVEVTALDESEWLKELIRKEVD